MTGQELDIIEVNPAPAPMNLFGADNPEEVVQRASETATALTDVIQNRGLFKDISGKSHVLVDGWTLLGSMLGVFPVVVWTRQLENGWEARVEARTLAGQVVGAAEAECLRSEKMWAGRDDYALRGMAQTRATSRALRGPLGFIVHLAGFAATPAEEMPTGEGDAAPSHPPAERQRTQAQNRNLNRILGELKKSGTPPPDPHEDWKAYSRAWTVDKFGKASSADLTVEECGQLIDHLDVPFG